MEQEHTGRALKSKLHLLEVPHQLLFCLTDERQLEVQKRVSRSNLPLDLASHPRSGGPSAPLWSVQAQGGTSVSCGRGKPWCLFAAQGLSCGVRR